jgi:dTDP-4-amino-4,6-dideoxygalactose transaminase
MNGKPITASLSPNVEQEDVNIAWRTLLHPSTTESTGSVTNWFINRYCPADIRLTGSGRGALSMILTSFGTKTGDEVIVQAYTCMVVINAIRSVGATPIFCDIDETLNIDASYLSTVITKKTKAVILQHTFGVAADIASIKTCIANKGIALIEDCAHSLGAQYDGKPLGSFGDAAFFSFGRDKAVSSVWGGAAMLNETGKKYTKNAFASCVLTDPPASWVRTQILHPILFSLFLPIYRYKIGKIGIELCKRLGLISRPVELCEKNGVPAPVSKYSYAPDLAALLLPQLRKLDRYVKERQMDADVYAKQLTKKIGCTTQKIHPGSSPMRFTIFIDHPDVFVAFAKKRGILLGRWYSHIIDPAGSSYEKAGYRLGSCPNAERYATQAVNLPTRIPPFERETVIKAVMEWKGNA